MCIIINLTNILPLAMPKSIICNRWVCGVCRREQKHGKSCCRDCGSEKSRGESVAEDLCEHGFGGSKVGSLHHIIDRNDTRGEHITADARRLITVNLVSAVEFTINRAMGTSIAQCQHA